MLFNSLAFLVFLPLAALLFWGLPARFRLPWMLLASLVFYGSFGVANLAYLGVVAAIALAAGRYLLAPGAAHRTAVFWGGVAAILGLLAALKYYDPVAEAVAWLPPLGLSSPAGFSFYAFTAIALLADRHRSPEASAGGVLQDLVFLAWFPKILAGPIERIGTFAGELGKRPAISPPVLTLALQLILWGLVKKVVIADNLAPFVDRTYAIPDYAVPMELILASYFFALQIYCDFSGYTDIARGASLLFGVKLSENFRRSYFAHSISEFWARRWHVSLADWFRDYVYYPFSSGHGALRMYIGLMLVFVASGIWHAGLGYGIGWGFLAWGALNGVYLWVERALSPLRRRLRGRLRGTALGRVHTVAVTLLVFHLIVVSWVFFRAGNLSDAGTVLSRIWAALPELPGLIGRYPFTAEHAFLGALILALLAIELVLEQKQLTRRLARAPRALRWAAWYGCLFALILLGRWQAEAFVYMQF
ncbi:MBOAT family O-acyltransferase [Actibacterium sp. MT2.3-13A]|uniref:MBOAT family O-acyltransferase n=1 Tax=Actibacterium sp. MT2.3-13A TaxID=2828332 RepID=UPI001BA6B7A3|nr:MBOAT family O-acyltransferase [Actibacterium sp. MT2.3-13A]